jgi:hypothetical protein
VREELGDRCVYRGSARFRYVDENQLEPSHNDCRVADENEIMREPYP